mmetsp:Transcript_34534/g.54015  ORF Transcript_34534/g.54015 Transcript_34534/m.54015 type:complete len:220 (+) Transcript_34534:1616-2275(+)
MGQVSHLLAETSIAIVFILLLVFLFLILVVGIDEPPSVHGSLAFGGNGVRAFSQPSLLARLLQQVCSIGRQMDTVPHSGTFDTRSSIHCVPKELETRFVTPKDTSRDGPAMKTGAHGQVGGIGTESDLQLLCKLVELVQALSRELCHDDGMVLTRFWQTCHCDVAIANGLDLEDTTAFGDSIERPVHGLEQGKDLRRFSHRTPGGKTSDIRKHDGRIGE